MCVCVLIAQEVIRQRIGGERQGSTVLDHLSGKVGTSPPLLGAMGVGICKAFGEHELLFLGREKNEPRLKTVSESEQEYICPLLPPQGRGKKRKEDSENGDEGKKPWRHFVTLCV